MVYKRGIIEALLPPGESARNHLPPGLAHTRFTGQSVSSKARVLVRVIARRPDYAGARWFNYAPGHEPWYAPYASVVAIETR